jgi:hypothetical protein
MADHFELTLLDDAYAVCRLEPAEPVPAWALAGPGLAVIVRTEKELSIVCVEALVAPGVQATPGWHALEVHGPFAFDTVGVVSRLSGALAAHGVSLLTFSTWETDYLLVQARDLGRAVRALRHDGHVVHTRGGA